MTISTSVLRLAGWLGKSGALVAALALALGVAQSAGAATQYNYSDYNGISYDFTGLNETVQSDTDDLNALFEAPTGSGNGLIFSPSAFLADSSGGVGGIDTSHSTFNATITSNGASTIDLISINEGGDIILSDFPPGSGTATTGGFATLSGTVTILNSTNAGDIGQIITFGGGGGDFDTTFTGPAGSSTNFLYVGLQPSGTFSWTGSVDIDIASLFPGATQIELQMNNLLQANSEAGTSSLIQKKAVSGPTILVVPEPGTFALICGGLLGIAVRTRRIFVG